MLLLFFWVACLVRHPIRKFKRNESVTEKRISCPCICQEIQKMNRAEVHPPVTGCSRCVQSLSLCSCAEETPSTDFHPQPTRKWKDSQISHQSASEANLALSSHECAVSPNCQNDFACTLQRDVVEGSVHHLRESAAMESQMHRANIQTSNKFSNPVPLRSRPSVHVQALGKDFASMLRLDAERTTHLTNKKQSHVISSLNSTSATVSPRKEKKESMKYFCVAEEVKAMLCENYQSPVLGCSDCLQCVSQCCCTQEVRPTEYHHQGIHRKLTEFQSMDDDGIAEHVKSLGEQMTPKNAKLWKIVRQKGAHNETQRRQNVVRLELENKFKNPQEEMPQKRTVASSVASSVPTFDISTLVSMVDEKIGDDHENRDQDHQQVRRVEPSQNLQKHISKATKQNADMMEEVKILKTKKHRKKTQHRWKCKENDKCPGMDDLSYTDIQSIDCPPMRQKVAQMKRGLTKGLKEIIKLENELKNQQEGTLQMPTVLCSVASSMQSFEVSSVMSEQDQIFGAECNCRDQGRHQMRQLELQKQSKIAEQQNTKLTDNLKRLNEKCNLIKSNVCSGIDDLSCDQIRSESIHWMNRFKRYRDTKKSLITLSHAEYAYKI